MSNGKYEKLICDAIETLVDRAVEKAAYDRTIKATVIEHTDATIGKYKVKYQDSTFYAYATDVSANYSKGSSVYILIHANDMEKDKTIIGSVEKLGLDYIPVIDDTDAYNRIGENCIAATKDGIGLCSYNRISIPFSSIKGDYEYLYQKGSSNNKVTLLEVASIENYMKQSSSLICGATFKTNLPAEQRDTSIGTYGIEFDLVFNDKSGSPVTRTYHIDVNDMTGTPFEYTNGSAQYKIFDIDGANFVEINEIRIFCSGFPVESSSKPDDIFISQILVQGAKRFEEKDLNGCFLNISTPQGAIFTKDNLKKTLNLKATLRVKGKVVTDAQEIKYYWFRENPSVSTRDNDKFFEQGGLGWECLNKVTSTIPVSDEENVEVSEFVPLGDTFTVNREDVKAKTAKYKAVAIYNGSAFAAEVVLYNFDFQYEIIVRTLDNKTTFTGVETPIVVCEVFDSSGNKVTDNLLYSWGEINAYGQFSSYQSNNNSITVNMNKILTFATYKCAVYLKDGDNAIFLGAAAIQLKNEDLEEIELYSLVINNGSQVFKYNEKGISPASKSLDSPITIPELSFTLYNPDGTEVSVVESNVWYVPTENTMIKLLVENPQKDEAGKYYVVKNPTGGKLSYTIDNNYDASKINNTIKLVVTNGGTSYVETTNLLFIKDGDSGTNGTDYVLQIVPNVRADSEANPMYAVVNKSGNKYTWNFTPAAAGQYLKLIMYKSGVPIYSGADVGTVDTLEEFGEGEIAASPQAKIEWINLIHKYGSGKQDLSDIAIDLNSGKAVFAANYQTDEDATANIIQARVSYNNGFYSATAPIITSYTKNDSITIKYEAGSGFTSVVYSSDGMLPQYNDRTPFRVVVAGIDNDENLEYNWGIRGKINGKNLSNPYLKLVKKTNFTEIIEENNTLIFQKWIAPVDKCNAEALTNSIYFEIKNKNTNEVLAWIRIPVHFLLNKYGQAALNGWDGNSIDINEENGYILSPQIGAGKKNADNSFSGILMGEVKEYHTGEELSHTGIIGYSGGKKTLFINAEDGSAIFGKFATESSDTASGQIIVDPSHNQALLYSSNFFKKYDKDGKPTKIDSSNETGNGMIINLSEPEIRYGNKLFGVDKNGSLTSAAGTIGGWNITKNALYSENYKVGMGAYEKLNEEKEQTPITAVVKAPTDSGIGSTLKSIAFWAGGSLSSDNTIKENTEFLVSHDGYLKATEASIGGGSTPIFIGKSTDSNSESAIYYIKKNSFNGELAKQANGFYLGASGLSIGSYSSLKNDSTIYSNAFEVTNKGALTARLGYIGDGETGWKISSKALTHNKDLMFSGKDKSYVDEDGNEAYVDGTYLGVEGFELGKAVMKMVYNSTTSATETGDDEGNIQGYKQVQVPGFWVRAGEETGDNIDGTVGINRGYIAGTWRVTEKGICSRTLTNGTEISKYAAQYYGESKALQAEGGASDEIPKPVYNSADGCFYLSTGDSSKIKLSPNNNNVKLLSFSLPNQIGRSIGYWGGNNEFQYSYQRIVAGKTRETQVDEFKPLNVKEWSWELLDDGSMYARRAVISTNREKTYDSDGSGVYIGPEGISVGENFRVDKKGNCNISEKFRTLIAEEDGSYTYNGLNYVFTIDEGTGYITSIADENGNIAFF